MINARTDVFPFEVGDPSGRLDEVVGRAKAYAEAGADCLFVMTGPGGPSVADLSAVGVQRVSVGTATAETAYTAAPRAARELLTDGPYPVDQNALSYGDINCPLA